MPGRDELPLRPADGHSRQVTVAEESGPRIAHAATEPSALIPQPQVGSLTDAIDRLPAEDDSLVEWGAMERPPDVPVRPALPRAAMPRAAVPTLAAEPRIVRIHIGRVEIRAATPPAPAKVPRPARPSSGLSLDQYLAGKRRP